jgi:hypothetical protein
VQRVRTCRLTINNDDKQSSLIRTGGVSSAPYELSSAETSNAGLLSSLFFFPSKKLRVGLKKLEKTTPAPATRQTTQGEGKGINQSAD